MELGGYLSLRPPTHTQFPHPLCSGFHHGGRFIAACTASVRTPVELRIAGEAQDDESLLVFVDRLFAHPSFERPNLQNESRQSDGGLGFSLTVTFYPDPAAAAPAAPAAADAAGGAS